jgi:hypothetical protein
MKDRQSITWTFSPLPNRICAQTADEGAANGSRMVLIGRMICKQPELRLRLKHKFPLPL